LGGKGRRGTFNERTEEATLIHEERISSFLTGGPESDGNREKLETELTDIQENFKQFLYNRMGRPEGPILF